MKHFVSLFCSLLLAHAACIAAESSPASFKADSRVSPAALEAEFAQPPEDQRVGCYWYWTSDVITKEGIIADLKAMKKAGITRAYIGLTGGGKTTKFFSDEWWSLIHTAMKTAGELGIEIGTFNSPGWSQSGGPWVKPEQSMRYLAAVQATATGPKKFAEKIPVTEKDIHSYNGGDAKKADISDWQDIKVLAFPVKAADYKNLFQADGAKVTVTENIKNENGQYKLPEKAESSITLTLPNAAAAQSLTVNITGRISSNAELQIKDGDKFKSIKKFRIDRTDTGLSRGFQPYSPIVITFPEVKSAEYKVIFRDSNKDGAVTSLSLAHAPLIERYPEKTEAKLYNSITPPWNAYMWERETADASLSIKPEEVKDISQHLAKDGTLTWDVPAGDWVILRLGMLPTGTSNSPCPEGASGFEVDKISAGHTAKHFDAYIGEILRRIPAKDRKTFKVNILDSYEKGGQNFTDDFINIFKKRYGYDPTPYFPTYYGYPVGSPELSDRFLWDVRRLVADMVAYEYVAELRRQSHRNGMTVWLENYGHWGFPGEFLQYGGQSDEVGGEFWTPKAWGPFENQCAVSAAHIYGKKKVWAEAQTGGPAFIQHPGSFKANGDWAFAGGINAFILHVYVYQQADNAYPGKDEWYGVEFNRKNTWFSQLDLYTDYIRRSGVMLQQGLNVADVAYFIGEDAPKMAGITEPPVPKGYSYDHINAEVLLKYASVKDGKLTLPHGTQYRVLALPPIDSMRPEVLRKIGQLVSDGLLVVGKPPVRSPSLENYPAADKEVAELAKKIWSGASGTTWDKATWSKTSSKGKILTETTLDEVFKTLDVPPDFICDNDSVLFTHRRGVVNDRQRSVRRFARNVRQTADNSFDIYYLSNQSDKRIAFSPQFRVAGKQPELWLPVSGKRRVLPAFTQNGKMTTVPLQLEPSESVFVVFRNPSSATGSTDAAANFPAAKNVTEITSPWTLTFESDEVRRGPAEAITLKKLEDLSKSTDDRIKYYSGTVIYKTAFDTKKTNSPLYLDLGKVAVSAKIKVNGKYAGGVWTAPYKIDIAPFVNDGNNSLEVEVVNLWANRMIGDKALPENQRKLNKTGRSPGGNPLESGLLGPVTVSE
ncbi:MAG: hypothetical protein LBT89_07160 [Planctomycetaceae bacterium]|jgi:hypothetical protein|nr:hypothetical protein [Planctomycetaceae bacterium]